MRCIMRLSLALILCTFLGVTYALGDLAYFLMNNKYRAPVDITRDYMPLVKLGSLPPKLVSVLRRALDDGFDHSFLAHVVDASDRNLEMAFNCIKTNDTLKRYQSCMLQKSGMNPFFIYLFDCMGHYEKWHNISPMSNRDKRMANGELVSWSLASFKREIWMADDESLRMEYGRCETSLKKHTVLYHISQCAASFDTGLDPRETSILEVLLKFEDLLASAPLALHISPPKLPSELIPIVLRHYVAKIKYQAIIDKMTFDWSQVPLDILEATLKDIDAIHRNRPLDPHVFASIKYFDYASESSSDPISWSVAIRNRFNRRLGSFKSLNFLYSTDDILTAWWETFYNAMYDDNSFKKFILTAMADFEHVPTELQPPLHEMLSSSRSDSFEDTLTRVKHIAISDFYARYTQKNPRSLVFLMRSEIQNCNWRAYKPVIDQIESKVENLLSYHFKLRILKANIQYSQILPSDPKYVEVYLIRSFSMFLSIGDSFSSAALLLHPSLHTDSDLRNTLFLALAAELSVKFLMRSLLAGCDLSGGHSNSFAQDLYAIFRLPHSATEFNVFDDIKTSIHRDLVSQIQLLGGPEFANFDYSNVKSLPDSINVLSEIRAALEQGQVHHAYLLAFCIPAFAHPRYPDNVRKEISVGMILYGFTGLEIIFQDKPRFSIIQSIFGQADKPSMQDTLVSLDLEHLKRLVSIAGADRVAFAEELVRVPNLLSDEQWKKVSLQVASELNLSQKIITKLRAIRDYDKMLEVVRGAMNKIFYDKEQSTKILQENPDICGICRDIFVNDEGSITDTPFGALHPCKHLFHKACFEASVRASRTRKCPVCRTLATEIDGSNWLSNLIAGFRNL